MNHPTSSPKILVAPLDWGLGHATRCIPIIKQLLADKCTVVIAASGPTKKLLQAEFPELQFLHLAGYNIKYSSSGWGLPFKIVAQIPKLLSAIKGEHEWLKKVVIEEGVDAVISDNRYGLNHAQIPSVFITHQLLIKVPIKLMENFVQRTAYRYIKNFHECWIPDCQGETNLAGALSHPPLLPQVPVCYIGSLSRFSLQKTNENGPLLILLSGPEPQRSLLEKLLAEELKAHKDNVVLIRGLPGNDETIPFKNNVTVFNHLPAAELEEQIRNASFVISRCGYSTVMDLSALKKKSILIPTPGQTEQEYLSKHLMRKNFALCIPQKKFRLKQAVNLAQSFNYQFEESHQNNFHAAIKNLLTKINLQRK